MKYDRAIDYYRSAIKNLTGLFHFRPKNDDFLGFYVAYLNLGLVQKGDIWGGLSNLKESMKGGEEIKETIKKKGYRLFLQYRYIVLCIKGMIYF